MSLRYEQYHSLKATKEFLSDLLTVEGYPQTKAEMRGRASYCLRHFPMLDKNGKPIFSNDRFTKE